jgi:hypothetical protein
VIQVCSGCGTRWNVRDRQRVWCPRCRGTLLAPTASEPVTAAPWTGHVTNAAQPSTRLPQGYRWVAVRPGAPPPSRPRRRPLGPTPRYLVVPRWGLVDRGDAAAAATSSPEQTASPTVVRRALSAAVVALGIAALVHLVRYLLLIINRSTLLNPIVAEIAIWLGVLASMAALGAVVICTIVLTQWLIARRAAAFRHQGASEPRRGWVLWAGCLLPPGVAVLLALGFATLLATFDEPSWAVMALFMALAWLPLVALMWPLVYVLELVKAEGHYERLGTSVWMWWLLWLISSMVAVFATETRFERDAQGIANNTAVTTAAYLLAGLAVLAAARVVEGFEHKPVERPAHRWVVVGDDQPGASGSAAAVELEGREPAA